jgi:general stress protein 26
MMRSAFMRTQIDILNSRLEAGMDRRDIYNFLKSHRYGVVSSVSADGLPQSALVGIAITPNLDIVFDTLKSSRKYPNLLRNPRCSFVIGWTGEQTLQLEGVAEEPSGDELARLQAAYFEAWPDAPARMQWHDIAYLVVHPIWLRYSDYAQTPPFAMEAAVDGSL